MPESVLSGEDKVINDKGCLSSVVAVSFLPSYSMVALSFKTGQTLLGKLDLKTFQIGQCLLIPPMESIKKPTASLLSTNGDFFHSFREISYMNSERLSSIFLLATFSKAGGALPCILEITSEKVLINIIKSKNLNNKQPVVHGWALTNPSFKKTWRHAPRLITFEENGASLVFHVDLKLSDPDEKKNQGILAELHA